MKIHKDLLWTLLGTAVIAALVALVYWSKQPAPLELELSESKKSPEHALVDDVLADPEGFAAAEEAALQASTSALSASTSSLAVPVPLPVVGEPLPVAWQSQPAPRMDQVTLSPALQRSLAASAPLRTEAYIDPNSDLNRERIAALRHIREQRQELK